MNYQLVLYISWISSIYSIYHSIYIYSLDSSKRNSRECCHITCSFEEIIMYKYLFRVRVQQRTLSVQALHFSPRGIWLQRQILDWPVRDGHHLRTSSALSSLHTLWFLVG